MSKQEYKNRLAAIINEMMAAGADRNQLLNALTEYTLDFMKDFRKKPDKISSGKDGVGKDGAEP